MATILDNNVVGLSELREYDKQRQAHLPTELNELNKYAVCTFNITDVNTTINIQNITNMSEINWGDGIIDTNLSHTYTNIGEYTCIIKGVTSIGESAFSSCRSLTSITIGNSVTSIGDWAFDNCDSLTSIEIGSGVTSIGDHAFSGCSSLTSIEIGSGVTSIGDWAFYNCDSLTSVVIPNSVTSIGERAFYDCSSLTSIEIPNSVESIGDYAFSYCRSLTSIVIKTKTPPSLSSTYVIPPIVEKIIVPIESINLYKEATNWSYYADKIVGVVDTDYLEEKLESTGADGITPQLRINEENYWEVSYDNGNNYTSLGVKATGEQGIQGEPGVAGSPGEAGQDGVTPQLRINSSTNFWEVSYDQGSTWTSLNVKAIVDNINTDTSITIGSSNSVTNNNSIAIGTNNEVTSNASMAFGIGNQVTKENGIAGGYYNTVTGYRAVAFCYKNTVEGNESIAAGLSNKILLPTEGNSDACAVFGYNNTLTYPASFAANKNNTILSSASAAFGDGNTITSSTGFAIGRHNKNNAWLSFVGGDESETNVHGCFVFGANVIKSNVEWSAAFGRYNENKTNTIFEVGNGYKNADGTILRRNAFEVTSSGTVIGGKSTSSTDSNLVLVTKDYVDKLETRILALETALSNIATAEEIQGIL